MLVIGERINASRKAIRTALERMDAAVIQDEACAQAQAGAHYIDVNGGTFPGREAQLLCWLVEVVQQATPQPLCLDSSDPDAIAAALPLVKTACPMINSLTLEPARFERMLPLIRDFRAKVVALCQGTTLGGTAQQKVDLASRLVERLTTAGIALDDIYVDPLAFPVATDAGSGRAAIEAIGTLVQRFPGLHTICGLTNVSHGLPARKLVNRTFLVAAMSAGLDAAILDPTDRDLMAALFAAEVVLGRDEYCLGFLKAFRSGKLA